MALVLFLLACGAATDPRAEPHGSTTATTTPATDGGGAVDTGSHGSSTPDTGDDPSDGGGTTTAPTRPTVAECFADIGIVVDYASLAPVMGTHCLGTDHQDIEAVERVVFIGDSVTLGTPPTAAGDWYRNRLADEFVARFGLHSPDWFWQNVDLLNGTTWTTESGDFASCAKYGARTDDLLLDPHRQLESCLPEDQRDKRTLVIMTVGGNDLFALLEGLRDGEDPSALQEEWEGAMSDLRDAVHWLTEDPSRFPGGLYLIFANIFDVSDATAGADIARCEGAQLIGLDGPLYDPWVAERVRWWQEQSLALAVETGTDMVFMGEAFCGHGYNYDDRSGRCYRGAEAELWYDLTCMHPNAAGHEGIAELFLAVVEE